LILSAQVNGEPVETVRVSLRDFKVKESRGFENKESKYNTDIIQLISENMDQLKRKAI
jgi:hypothetical protein